MFNNYIEGLQVIISKQNIFLSLKIDFVLTNSADPDKMPPYALFHLGLQCFPSYPFRVSIPQRVNPFVY